MSSKKVFYSGKYVEDIKDILISAFCSRSNVILMTPPGWGKTEIPNVFMDNVLGPDHHNMIAFTPSTPVARVEGAIDPKAYAETGKYIQNISGTPYDPEMRGVMFDELFRGSDPSYDSSIHATDPLKQHHCTVIATSNFVTLSDRLAALVDRFPFWYWHKGGTVDVAAIVTAQMESGGKPQIPGTLPTWEQIEDVRKATPGIKATEAVVDYLEGLAQEAVAEGFMLNPRRIAHWRKILYYTTVYYTGTADFSVIPPEATRVMQWAWTSTSQEEADHWQKIAKAIVDRVGAVIDEILAGAVDHFIKVSELPDSHSRTAAAAELGPIMAQAQETLNAVGGNDPRINEAIVTMSDWFRMAVQGQKPELGS